ncbi:uncharacterized protein LACBIDRAFT_303495 [Laccaria bicolor S238N-H82]|uniref:Predicted protein n=1 Tax=Laccaria bicolor (strain S238N-H82 / ATCC MYA-4686) TaxID=486041 RepID=B0DJK7_LACBS|nr:uncharacterized protein LACBIDRAFT_303495 [Laccaria bicolor S238N-H82]EDR05135.1 predicted protein [Laccaria bicolor S238N-H82]|eukprot:XP_001884100.1 predicted protein [Laccaria bicolor S238N-H82]
MIKVVPTSGCSVGAGAFSWGGCGFRGQGAVFVGVRVFLWVLGSFRGWWQLQTREWGARRLATSTGHLNSEQWGWRGLLLTWVAQNNLTVTTGTSSPSDDAYSHRLTFIAAFAWSSWWALVNRGGRWSPLVDGGALVVPRCCHLVGGGRLWMVVVPHWWSLPFVGGVSWPLLGCVVSLSLSPLSMWLVGGNGGGEEDGRWVEKKECCICLVALPLFGNKSKINKQLTGFRCIPFLPFLQNIPVSIPECPNSAGMVRHRNDENSRPPC